MEMGPLEGTGQGGTAIWAEGGMTKCKYTVHNINISLHAHIYLYSNPGACLHLQNESISFHTQTNIQTLTKNTHIYIRRSSERARSSESHVGCLFFHKV